MSDIGEVEKEKHENLIVDIDDAVITKMVYFNENIIRLRNLEARYIL
jgi:hypothetical protein